MDSPVMITRRQYYQAIALSATAWIIIVGWMVSIQWKMYSIERDQKNGNEALQTLNKAIQTQREQSLSLEKNVGNAYRATNASLQSNRERIAILEKTLGDAKISVDKAKDQIEEAIKKNQDRIGTIEKKVEYITGRMENRAPPTKP